MIKRVVIVHGHKSNPKKYWFENLKKYIEKLGCEDVIIPQMPHPQLPDIRSWKKVLSMLIQENCENTAIIGHSFGGISAFRFAETLSEGIKLGAIIAVASPIIRVWNPILPSKIMFREPNWDLVVSKVITIYLVHSTDDWIAPFCNATHVQTKTNCDLLSLQGYHHICCTHLPYQAKYFIAKSLGFA